MPEIGGVGSSLPIGPLKDELELDHDHDHDAAGHDHGSLHAAPSRGASGAGRLSGPLHGNVPVAGRPDHLGQRGV